MQSSFNTYRYSASGYAVLFLDGRGFEIFSMSVPPMEELVKNTQLPHPLERSDSRLSQDFL